MPTEAPIDALLAPFAWGFGPLTLAQTAVLVSWWKALLIVPPFLGWAWVVSSVLDKHASRFYLGAARWGAIHLSVGLVALAVVLLMPIPAWWGFLVGYALLLALLAGDIVAFAAITNKDEKVPEQHRLRLDFSKLAEAREAKEAAKLAGSVTLKIKTASGNTLPPPEQETPAFEIRSLAEQMFIRAQSMGAQRLDLIAGGKEGQSGSSFVVDGVRQAGDPLTPQQAIAVIDFWKSVAELDQKDRRKRQIGECKIASGEVSVPVRVVTQGQSGGVRLSLIFDPAKAVVRPLEDLGLLPQQRELLDTLGTDEGGLVLLAAPSGHGRTTTLYSVLRLHDAYTENVQTLELEPQASLEGIRQEVYRPGEAAEFAIRLRTLLRRDPDVVAVAELPDVETAKEAAAGDLSRSRVYLSVKAEDALTAVQLYVKAHGDPEKSSAVLRGVVAQKLARKLCENCRVPYQPPAAMLQKLGLPEGKVKQLFKKGGQVLIRNKPEVCPICQGIGYRGQIGLFEVFPVGEEERALIAAQDWSGLRAAWRRQQHPTIQQAALRRAVEGVTSVEEVTRVTSQKKPGGSSTKAA